MIYKISYSYRDNGVILRKSAVVQASNQEVAVEKLRRWFIDIIGCRPDFRITGKSLTSFSVLIK